MSTTFQIIYYGCVHVCSRRQLDFDTVIAKARRGLEGVAIGSTFHALRSRLGRGWLIRDDVVKPFGDNRQSSRSVCTFDLDRGLFLYEEGISQYPYPGALKSSHLQFPLSRLRDPGLARLQRSDFTTFEPDAPPTQDLSAFSPPYHKPLAQFHTRRLILTTRIFQDFSHQWRHVLRTSYADTTFRRFAKAIVSIATCNFRIDKISSRRSARTQGPVVSVLDLPTWEPYGNHIFIIGRTVVILNQELSIALSTAKAKAKEACTSAKPASQDACNSNGTYLLFSLRYMVLCHADSTGNLIHTRPLPFMDGLTPPTESSIAVILQALMPSHPCPRTPIHRLPVELQDRILQYVSKGSFEAARLGYVLDLGSAYRWTRAKDWPRRAGPVELSMSNLHRTGTTPVESRISFGDAFSGISYK